MNGNNKPVIIHIYANYNYYTNTKYYNKEKVVLYNLFQCSKFYYAMNQITNICMRTIQHHMQTWYFQNNVNSH